MVCTSYGDVIVCGPPRGVYRRTERDCPECETRHDFVERWDGAWYGNTLYGSCGDTWQDGYRAQRPFLRYWRRDAQEYFRRMWDNAAPADLYEAYVQADVDLAVATVASEITDAIERREAARKAIGERATEGA